MTTEVNINTKPLGLSGLTVPALCIGTWAWGDKLFWGYGSNYGESQVREAFRAAVESGVTFFDTAEVYGPRESERLLGRFMKGMTVPVQIATKYGPFPWRITEQSVADALSASLERLQTDYVALYQVHWPFSFLMSQETLLKALANEVKRGRIGAVGVSNYSAEQMTQAHNLLAKWGVPLATNQVRYSLLARQIERQGVLATARKLGITILAYSPLAQGLLTGKYTPGNPPGGARSLDSRFSRNGLKKIASVMDLLHQFGETHGHTPAQVALNWLIAQEGVIPIAGSKTAAQVQQNIGALGWSLSEQEVAELEQASRPWLK